MFQRTKETSWKPQEENVHFLDIVNILRNLEYIFLVKKKVKISRDVTFDEDVSLGKERDLTPPPPLEKNDDMDILDGPFVTKSEINIVNDPMDSLYPPQYDPPTRKRPLWLQDILQDDER